MRLTQDDAYRRMQAAYTAAVAVVQAYQRAEVPMGDDELGAADAGLVTGPYTLMMYKARWYAEVRNGEADYTECQKCRVELAPMQWATVPVWCIECRREWRVRMSDPLKRY
jgi:hypothetical protein